MLLMAVLLFSGCSLVKINTNIPLFYDYSFEVINASDYELEATANGEKLVFRFDDDLKSAKLKPGQSATIRFQNYSGYTSETTVSVKGWYPHGEFVGAATTKIYIAGNRKQSDSWIVRNDDFRNHYRWERWGRW